MADKPTEILIDSRGRKLRVRDLGVLEQARMYRMMGPEDASNRPYSNIVRASFSLTHIDDFEMPPLPVHPRDFDSRIALMDDEGFVTIFAWQMKKVTDATEAAHEAMARLGDPDPVPTNGGASATSPSTPTSTTTSS